MENIKNKFVLVDGEIIASRVVFHKEIHKNPQGGGWWYFHRKSNKLFLYGKSHDFGGCTKDQIENATLGGSFRNLEDVEIIFDERDHLEILSILSDHLDIMEAAECVSKCDFI